MFETRYLSNFLSSHDLQRIACYSDLIKGVSNVSSYADYIGKLAVYAALVEAFLSPKPGLVCRNHNGSHHDMTIQTFIDSALSLETYFKDAFRLGYEQYQENHDKVFSLLRPVGVRAEKSMLKATKGINTHRGLIFSLGLIVTALGRLKSLGREPSVSHLCEEAGIFVKDIVKHDFVCLHALMDLYEAQNKDWQILFEKISQDFGRSLTSGEKLYVRYRVTGVRGEAEKGFPHVIKSFEQLEFWFTKTDDSAVALVHTLLFLMTEMQDTNILQRGDAQKLSELQKIAENALSSGGLLTEEGKKNIEQIQYYCHKHWLSPGGCADILAVTVFLYLLKDDLKFQKILNI